MKPIHCAILHKVVVEDVFCNMKGEQSENGTFPPVFNGAHKKACVIEVKIKV